MKQLKLTVALCALAVVAKAQPYTGQSYYNHNGTAALLSSGIYAAISPGFLMAGYVPSTPAGSPNFFIDKTDVKGNFSGSPGEISRQYLFYTGGVACSSALSQAPNCYGVSVKENIAISGVLNYGLAAAFDAGCLFAILDASGSVLIERVLNFPQGAVPDSKPLVTYSPSQDYYCIAGSYNLSGTTYMYVFCMNSSGSGIWDLLFDFGTNNIIQPRDMLIDSYSASGNPQLTIAGYIIANPSLGGDGFILRLDAATGAINDQWGVGSGSFSTEWFSAIQLSAGVPSGNGYILGGYTDYDPTSGHAWMLSLYSNVSTVNWSTRMTPSTNNLAGDVVGLSERFSSTYGAYEYYGATISGGSAGGMMVLKLDQGGNPFGMPGNTNNEFLYDDAFGNIGLTNAITTLDAGPGAANTGIHVFGNTKNGPSDFFLDMGYFNGATGTCNNSQQNLTMMNNINPGPSIVYALNLGVAKGLPLCPWHQLRWQVNNYPVTQPCSLGTPPVAPYPGNNSRTMAPTGIEENSASNVHGLSVFPNPVSNVAELNYNLNKSGEVKITLNTILGQQVRTLESGIKDAGTNTLKIDLGSMGLQDGVYVINVAAEGMSSQLKIIYNHN